MSWKNASCIIAVTTTENVTDLKIAHSSPILAYDQAFYKDEIHWLRHDVL